MVATRSSYQHRKVINRVGMRLERFIGPLVFFLSMRCFSAALNTIHDCDEVFNYWEPLHYVLYGYGLQTWEYSAEFALRAWFYILIHGLVGGPLSVLVRSGAGKIVVFYTVRLALALGTGYVEWRLYKALITVCGKQVARVYMILSCFSSGMFVSCSGFLPSSFTMMAMTAAAAGVLEKQPTMVIFAAVLGSVWGWIVAALSFVPYALWVLVSFPILESFLSLFVAALVAIVPLVGVDRLFYGSWKASLVNFLEYNVRGGGKSALYGVEPASYYVRNGMNQLQFVLPLFLILPLLLPLFTHIQLKSKRKRDALGILVIALSPAYVWLGAISMLPHKEERFLYVVYPLILAAAATVIVYMKEMMTMLLPKVLMRRLMALFILGNCILGISRTLALVWHYSAPLPLYRALPQGLDSGPIIPVCVGNEWYRFPSSFFLPGRRYRLQFVKSGFDGLLPRPFEESKYGTMAAPRQFNDMNREEPDNYWRNIDGCRFFVTMESGENKGTWVDEAVSSSNKTWGVLASRPFLDVARSPALTRAFYIPFYSSTKNKWLRYVLLQEKH